MQQGSKTNKFRKRCDEAHPVCSACSRLYLECVYPVPGYERKNRKWKPTKRSKSSDSDDSSHNNNDDDDLDVVTTDQFLSAAGAVTTTTNDNDDNSSSNPAVVSEQKLTLFDRSDNHAAKDITSLSLVEPNSLHTTDVLYFMDKSFDLTNADFSVYPAFDVDQFLAMSKPASPSPLSLPEPETASQVPPSGAHQTSSQSRPQTQSQHQQQNQFLPGLPNLHAQFSAFPPSSIAVNLDEDGRLMYDYFVNKLAAIICVSPENSFLNVFVPMAWESEAVLCGLIAWASFHKDHGRQQDVGYKYLNRAMQNVLAKFNSGDPSILSALLLICAGEICNGDVVHWNKHLSLAAKIINMNGGLGSFTTSKSLQWLASNFAYHDLLAASTTASRNTHFPPAEYEQIMRLSMGPDTLLGCCQPLFQILAEISDLAVEAQKLYTSTMASVDQLRDLRNRAAAIEHKISLCVPDRLSLMTLSSLDLERQMTLFEAFQLTAKIHLLQSVLRLNASSVEMQCLGQELLTTLDVVLGTPVEGGLSFPMFIAGVACPKGPERAKILNRFTKFYERNLARNIKRSCELLEEVWDRDEGGTKHIHWYSIIESRGWDLCFA